MIYPVAPQAPVQQPSFVPQQAAGPAEPPLTVSSVEIPADAIQECDGVTYFGVDVSSLQEPKQWRVMRRYNDFFILEKTLNTLTPGVTFPGAPFPGKRLGKCAGKALEE